MKNRLPESFDELIRTTNYLRDQFGKKLVDDDKRFQVLDKDIFHLKKKNNLSDLEHRIFDRIDDVVRALKAQCAEKNEVTKKCRLIENRLESTLDIIIMQLREDPNSLKEIA